MNILVTGGAGYIGSMLCTELLQHGHRVTVLDNFMFKQHSLGHLFHFQNFSLIKGDIRDYRHMKQVVPGFDVIIPLAAYVGMPLCNKEPAAAEATNQTATLAMFKLLAPAQFVVMPTTNSAYGSGDANHFCDETSTLNPISSYAKQKVAVEAALMERENAISFRLATVFGMSPRMRLDLLVNDFTWQAFNQKPITLFEPHFKRNYIHVKDVCRAFVHGLNNFSSMRGEVYNVGLSDANISKRELCDLIKQEIPGFTFTESANGKDPDQRNYIVSNAKIEATGFKPQYALSVGIRELLIGYQMLAEGVRYANV